MSDTDLSTINFKVSEALRKRLETAAQAEHRTLSNYLRVVLDATVPQQPKRKTSAR